MHMNDSIMNAKCIDHASTQERRSQVVQAHLHFRGKEKKKRSPYLTSSLLTII